MESTLEQRLKNAYDFRHDILDTIMSGKSTIDSLNSFVVKNLEEANHFIQSYGYNPENPVERAEILGNFHEALHFIRKYFLKSENSEKLKLEIPRAILELKNPRNLFLMASYSHAGQNKDESGTYLKNWACSLLKVMHTIAHIDKDVRSSYFPDIQKQIFDRFYEKIHRSSNGKLFLGEESDGPMRVHLVSFETKPKKTRESVILKLLHKPENVAQDIFDQVGIRFISHTPLDALRIVKFLKEKMIIMPPNIQPNRSRNTLIQIDVFREKLDELLHQAELGKISEEELRERLESAAKPTLHQPENPHSSAFYRAIQFTARQLIKLRNPIHDEIKELKNIAKAKPLFEELTRVIERIDLKGIQREIRFFYPFEVQILDQKSAEENEKGRSAHSKYKKAQILTAMNRVMGGFKEFQPVDSRDN